MSTCSITDCESQSRIKGLCYKHYWRLRNKGSPTARTQKDPNEFVDCGEHWEIYLYDIKCNHVASAKIDSEDVEKCRQYKWYLNEKGYVVSNLKASRLFLHRFIMNVMDASTQVDHIYGDKYDYRGNQLRESRPAQNSQNSKLYNTNTSGERNVCWNKHAGKWTVQIVAFRRVYYFGNYDNYDQACQVARTERKRLHGEFTRQG